MPALAADDPAAALATAPAPLLLDVREPEEFVGELGRIAGASLVPLARRTPRAALTEPPSASGRGPHAALTA